jgi:hypothetical protein
VKTLPSQVSTSTPPEGIRETASSSDGCAGSIVSPVYLFALFICFVSAVIRFWNVESLAGISYDDAAYAVAGKDLLLRGQSHWGDCYRPLMSWWVALFHWINGISIVNVGIAFAAATSIGHFLLVDTARRLFPELIWAPLMTALVVASSSLAAIYGHQHLSSLLLTIPLALWFYARFLERQRWLDWILCSISTGLIFLGHYNTIPLLCMMLVFEFARQKWVGTSWRLTVGRCVVTLVLAFGTVMRFGKVSYNFANEFTFIRRVWEQMATNQGRPNPRLTDTFLFNLASWEGWLVLGYALGLAYLIRLAFKDHEKRRTLAFALVGLLGIALIWFRGALGYLSFPRMYVFAFPILWLGLGALAARTLEGWILPRVRLSGVGVACGLAAVALFTQVSHEAALARHPSANAQLERYLKDRPTDKMSFWVGNPHLGHFLFGWAAMTPVPNKEKADADWNTFFGGEGGQFLSEKIMDPARRPYLERPDLPEVLDIIVTQTASLEMIRENDALYRKISPQVLITNFYNGAIYHLPYQGDERSLLGPRFEVFDFNALPMVRLYDFRGAPGQARQADR